MVDTPENTGVEAKKDSFMHDQVLLQDQANIQMIAGFFQDVLGLDLKAMIGNFEGLASGPLGDVFGPFISAMSSIDLDNSVGEDSLNKAVKISTSFVNELKDAKTVDDVTATADKFYQGIHMADGERTEAIENLKGSLERQDVSALGFAELQKAMELHAGENNIATTVFNADQRIEGSDIRYSEAVPVELKEVLGNSNIEIMHPEEGLNFNDLSQYSTDELQEILGDGPIEMKFVDKFSEDIVDPDKSGFDHVGAFIYNADTGEGIYTAVDTPETDEVMQRTLSTPEPIVAEAIGVAAGPGIEAAVEQQQNAFSNIKLPGQDGMDMKIGNN